MTRYGFSVDFVVTAEDPEVAQKLLEGLLEGPGSHFESEVINGPDEIDEEEE